jgi:hypothetical protein
LGKFSKKLLHFKEESYEIAKTFEEFVQIFLAFPLFKLPYLANRFWWFLNILEDSLIFLFLSLSCSQIWLNLLWLISTFAAT